MERQIVEWGTRRGYRVANRGAEWGKRKRPVIKQPRVSRRGSTAVCGQARGPARPSKSIWTWCLRPVHSKCSYSSSGRVAESEAAGH